MNEIGHTRWGRWGNRTTAANGRKVFLTLTSVFVFVVSNSGSHVELKRLVCEVWKLNEVIQSDVPTPPSFQTHRQTERL